MARNVFCKKYQKELEGMKALPFPGPKGQLLYDTISQEAWNAWLERQTMLINEKQLSMANKESRAYLSTQMEKFFNNEEVDQAEGYVAPKT